MSAAQLASPRAPQNNAEVKTGGGLDRAFLEIDLAKAVFKTVDERWIAARKG